MTATMKDVARKAGVSIMTVSNVIRGHEHVTKEVRERVMEALKELNYQPNLPARFLRKGRTGVVALAIPDLNNEYFADICNAVIAAAAVHSYTILLDHTRADRAAERIIVDGLQLHAIDGVILSPLAMEREDLLKRSSGLPLVLLGEHFFDLEDEQLDCDRVAIDDGAAARVATEHLLQIGKRRIAVIGAHGNEAWNVPTARHRLRGYREALEGAGIAFDPSLVFPAGYSRAGGAAVAREVLQLDPLPDAVFCFNDLMALGALRTLLKAEVRIPHDIAVVGFDDIEDSSYVTPSLTTIAPDKAKIGEKAFALLFERIQGTRSGGAERVTVPFRLVVRESTGGDEKS